jgi:hypothetical protein
VAGNGGEDDGEDADNDGAEEGDPEGATEEELADVRFADGDGTEGSLREERGAGQFDVFSWGSFEGRKAIGRKKKVGMKVWRLVMVGEG